MPPVFDRFLALPGWAILLALLLGFGTTGLALHRISFTWRGSARWASFIGVVAPFLTAPQALFALTAVFLASEAWQHDDLANRILLEERDAGLVLRSLSHAIPADGAPVRAALRAYVDSVLTDEWPVELGTGAPRTASLLDALLDTVADPAIVKSASPAVQGELVAEVLRIREARSGRLALRSDPADDLKWGGALGLALVAQVGIASVHLERARAQALALAIYTAGLVIMLGVVAMCERPFHGSHIVSPAPLRELLAALPG